MKVEIEEKDWVKLDDYGEEIEGLDVEYLLPSEDLSNSKLDEIFEEKFPRRWSKETDEEVPINGYFYRIGYLPFVRGKTLYRAKNYCILKLIQMYSRMIARAVDREKRTK